MAELLLADFLLVEYFGRVSWPYFLAELFGRFLLAESCWPNVSAEFRRGSFKRHFAISAMVKAMVGHGRPWSAMSGHGRPWLAMVGQTRLGHGRPGNGQRRPAMTSLGRPHFPQPWSNLLSQTSKRFKSSRCQMLAHPLCTFRKDHANQDIYANEDIAETLSINAANEKIARQCYGQ